LSFLNELPAGATVTLEERGLIRNFDRNEIVGRDKRQVPKMDSPQLTRNLEGSRFAGWQFCKSAASGSRE
jgi:hypothetical protein